MGFFADVKENLLGFVQMTCRIGGLDSRSTTFSSLRSATTLAGSHLILIYMPCRYKGLAPSRFFDEWSSYRSAPASTALLSYSIVPPNDRNS
jgi:hypothetical protein